MEIYFGWVGLGRHFYRWGVVGDIVWMSGDGWTFFMGRWGYVAVGGAIF